MREAVGRQLKRSPIHTDPAKVRSWRQRTAKRLPPMSARRQAELPERAVVREAVIRRDRTCQIAARGYLHTCWGPLTFHHRRKESDQGAYSMDNGAAVCAAGNDAMESDPDLARWARSVGLVVRRGDPEWESLGR